MDFAVFQDWTRYLLKNFVPFGSDFFYSLQSVISSALERITKQHDLASVALLLIIFFISLKILDMIYRMVVFWVTLVLRFIFYGALVIGGLYIWARGVDGLVKDIQYIGQLWMDEYQYWKEQTQIAKAGNQQAWSQYPAGFAPQPRKPKNNWG